MRSRRRTLRLLSLLAASVSVVACDAIVGIGEVPDPLDASQPTKTDATAADATGGEDAGVDVTVADAREATDASGDASGDVTVASDATEATDAVEAADSASDAVSPLDAQDAALDAPVDAASFDAADAAPGPIGSPCTTTSNCAVGVCIANVCSSSILDVATAGQEICAIRYPGTLKCWGRNTYGQLGQGDTMGRGYSLATVPSTFSPINLGTGRTATRVTVGNAHACAILDDGTVKCWGQNNVGQLGQGDTTNRGGDPTTVPSAIPAINLGAGRTAKFIHAEQDWTCAILDNGSVKCWGDNGTSNGMGPGDGELGQGTNVASLGGAPGDMSALQPLVFPSDAGAVGLASNASSTCAVLSDGTVSCWGNDVDEVVGGSERLSPSPARPLGAGAVALAGLYSDACAILVNGSLKCWGVGAGNLGLGNGMDYGEDAAALAAAPPIPLGTKPGSDGGTPHTVKRVVPSGANAYCVLLDDSTVKCVGSGGPALGYGNTVTIGTDAGQMGDALPALDFGTGRTVVELFGGFADACVVLDNDTLKCWGNNNYGQLGLGDSTERGDMPDQMGDNLPAIAF